MTKVEYSFASYDFFALRYAWLRAQQLLMHAFKCRCDLMLEAQIPNIENLEAPISKLLPLLQPLS